MHRASRLRPQLLNMPAAIVMPSDAPVSKIERTKGYGAEVIPYDRDKEDRDQIARDLAAKRGATVVPPYDDSMGDRRAGHCRPRNRGGFRRIRDRA